MSPLIDYPIFKNMFVANADPYKYALKGDDFQCEWFPPTGDKYEKKRSLKPMVLQQASGMNTLNP